MMDATSPDWCDPPPELTINSKGHSTMVEQHQIEQVPVNDLVFEDEKHLGRTLQALNMMRKNRHFCDVILHVGSTEIHSHRAVLASVSPYLFELFSADDESKGSVRENIITYKLNGIFDKNAFEKLIDYAYTARLQVPDHQVRSVYLAARQLKMDMVVQECSQHLIRALDIRNCIEIRSLPGISRNHHLMSKVDAFIAKEFSQIYKSPAISTLPCARIEVLHQTREEMSLVGSDSLCRLVLDWIRQHWEEEEPPARMEALTDKTHLLYLAMDNSLQDCSELPTGDVSDTELVQDYKKLSIKKKSQINSKSRRKGPLQPAKPRVIMYSREISGDERVEVQTEAEWKLIASVKVHDHSFLALATIDGCLTTMSVLLRLNLPSSPSPTSTLDSPPATIEEEEGEEEGEGVEVESPSNVNGVTDGEESRSAESCREGGDEEEEGEVRKQRRRKRKTASDRNGECIEGGVGQLPDLYCALPHMASVKCAVGCASLGGSLLVCGGYDRGECLRCVEVYHPAQNTWSPLPPMREARGRFAVAVAGDLLYAVGGSNGTTELDTAEVYDPKEGRWGRLPSMVLARSNAGVCELGGKIYCIGGWNGQVGIKQCEAYDPTLKQWTGLAPLQIGRYQAGVCSMDGRVYAAGGCDAWNCLNSVEVYDPTTDTWSFTKGMITARRGCGVAIFKGKLYVVGGSNGTQSLCSTEIFDPLKQMWIPGPNMTTPRANVGVAVIGDRLYAVGGFSGKAFLNSFEYLDENTDEWTTFVPKTTSTVIADDLRPGTKGLLLPEDENHPRVNGEQSNGIST
ncbi:influenza virus NS1A-binding protein homolog A-like isoform X1 [Hetaerina americana]|uniref:influenza virus NS1A-binding protein homolog A-like isoform X1 n=2 Tax=Hetaerina americana TaxID=62018 RepID=UPI003A7F5A71